MVIYYSRVTDTNSRETIEMQEAFQIEVLGHNINLIAFAALLSLIGAVLVSAIGYTNRRIAKQLEEDRNSDR